MIVSILECDLEKWGQGYVLKNAYFGHWRHAEYLFKHLKPFVCVCNPELGPVTLTFEGRKVKLKCCLLKRSTKPIYR